MLNVWNSWWMLGYPYAFSSFCFSVMLVFLFIFYGLILFYFQLLSWWLSDWTYEWPKLSASVFLFHILNFSIFVFSWINLFFYAFPVRDESNLIVLFLFCQFPVFYIFIWKWEKNTFPGNKKNVEIRGMSLLILVFCKFPNLFLFSLLFRWGPQPMHEGGLTVGVRNPRMLVTCLFPVSF